MPVVEARGVLRGIPVSEAMRRQVLTLPHTADIGQAIRLMIRHKAHAVLITDDALPFGVVSKTDLMGAMYAQFSVATLLGDVVGSQPIVCFADDPIAGALETMETAGVHRLYVTGTNREEIIGIVAYADIVGLLYRYCRACERGNAKKREKSNPTVIDPSAQYTVQEVMTQEVCACRDQDQLVTVIEILAARQVGAVLIQDAARTPVGVISKSDLIVAYLRGVSLERAAGEIMNSPVHCVPAQEKLSQALQEMLIRNVQRLFVQGDARFPNNITGVLALSDAARFRSGSCRACTAGRMLTRT